jgi:hypothetical protein
MPLRLIFATAFALLLNACAHYQLGTDGKLAFTTLYVEPVENKTLLPQSVALVSTQLREAFLRDGRVTLVNSPEGADATLKVVISDYHREVAAVREGDTGLARKFTLTLGVTCSLRDNRAGKALFQDRAINTQRGAFTGEQAGAIFASEQLQSEYQSLPLLAESIADKVSHAVLDVW